MIEDTILSLQKELNNQSLPMQHRNTRERRIRSRTKVDSTSRMSKPYNSNKKLYENSDSEWSTEIPSKSTFIF